MTDILVTVPKTIKWADYQLELDAAAAGAVMNFKVANLPRIDPDSRCYIAYDGFVRGWMQVVGAEAKGFTCTTTGTVWQGRFVERSGAFHPVQPVPQKGFQGFRYVDRTLFNDM